MAGIAYPKRDALRGWWRQQFGPTPAPIVAIVPLQEPGASAPHYGDTLSEDLAAHLGQTEGITILGRSSIRSFRGRQPSDVARQTGAAVVLTGTLARADGELNVDLRLVDPADGVELWRQQFTNSAASIVAGQAAMAEEIAEALDLSPAPGEIRVRSLARTVSPDAYETYTRGRDALARGEHESALGLFDGAIRQDDGFVEAYAAIAQALYARAAASGSPLDQQDVARLRRVVSRAAAIEPDLAWVEVAAGLAAPGLRESLRHLARAVTLDPSLAAGYRLIADLISPLDGARATSLTARARRLDPAAASAKPVETPAVVELRGRVGGERDRLRAIVDEELRAVR
jgi:TolB-like protein